MWISQYDISFPYATCKTIYDEGDYIWRTVLSSFARYTYRWIHICCPPYFFLVCFIHGSKWGKPKGCWSVGFQRWIDDATALLLLPFLGVSSLQIWLPAGLVACRSSRPGGCCPVAFTSPGKWHRYLIPVDRPVCHGRLPLLQLVNWPSPHTAIK